MFISHYNLGVVRRIFKSEMCPFINRFLLINLFYYYLIFFSNIVTLCGLFVVVFFFVVVFMELRKCIVINYIIFRRVFSTRDSTTMVSRHLDSEHSKSTKPNRSVGICLITLYKKALGIKLHHTCFINKHNNTNCWNSVILSWYAYVM